jgi:hypothetical protein
VKALITQLAWHDVQHSSVALRAPLISSQRDSSFFWANDLAKITLIESLRTSPLLTIELFILRRVKNKDLAAAM